MEKRIRILGIFLISGTILISSLPAFGQIDENYWENQWKAFAATSAAECQSSLKFCTEVLKVNPNHPVINYLSARLNEQLGNRDSALKYLKKAAKLGYTSDMQSRRYVHPWNDPVFSELLQQEAFQEVIEIMNISDKPIHKSQIAFTVDDKRLGDHEGITYDPVEKMFYLGTDSKIFKVDHSGKSTVFTREADKDGLNWVNGIHVDPVRRTLWACSKDFSLDNADIFKYDLSSGKLIKKYTSPSDGSRHFFNDLVIHPDGDVYITDNRALYIIPHASDKLELFYKNKLFTGANGITLSDDGQVIYAVDSVWGICKIDIKTKAFIHLTHEEDLNTHGIDGLYCKDNYLYATQNTLLAQASRFKLNKNATHIESCEIFEKNTPTFEPYTGVIVDDYFYFIAGNNIEGKVFVMKASLK